MDDYTREWINFLRSSAEDLKKSIPRPERYLTSSVLTLIIGVVAALAGWFGRLGGCWEKLLGGIGIAIILLILGALGLAYGIRLRSEQSRISKEKDNILMLIAMILGKRVISPEEIFNEWQKCEKKSKSFEEQKEIESAFKIKSSPENASLEDVKRGFKQLDEKSQKEYMTDLFHRKDHNVEIEEWLTKNYRKLSEEVGIKEMFED